MSQSSPVITSAASSGIQIDKTLLKQLAKRSDRQGLWYLAKWFGALIITSSAIWYSMDTAWLWLAMFIHGIVLSVPAYAISHETAHGSVFETRWLNKVVLWITSLIYMEEPWHRRYTHLNHHAHTWHVNVDSQMPFDTPMTFRGWLLEASGIALLVFHLRVLLALCFKRYSQTMLDVVPEPKLPLLTRNARFMVLIYSLIPLAAFWGITWPLWFIVIPRLLGAPVMLLFTLIQHVEMAENSPSIIDSTRSFRSNWLGRFLYANMNYHIEHHLYQQVPFYALPKLNEAIRDQLPQSDPGFFRTNLEVLLVVIKRSLRKNTRAISIRQAQHHVTEGSYRPIARATM